MQVSKPSDAIVLVRCGRRGGRPLVCVTIAYLVGATQALIAEQQAWRIVQAETRGLVFDEGCKKARGTFAVAGTALAPGGEAVRGMQVRVTLGAADKTLNVFGERVWRSRLAGWRIDGPQPFTSMPLDPAHAFGGRRWAANPLGRGVGDADTGPQDQPLANLETPGQTFVHPDDRPPVASFWPAPPDAPQRRALLGKLDAQWRERDFPSVPADTDPWFFDAVASDQCIDHYWQGNETWSAHGFTESGESLCGALPGLRPRLLWTTRDRARVASEAPLDLDTVWLMPNAGCVLLMYRALIASEAIDGADLDALRVVTERAAQPAATLDELAAAWWSELDQAREVSVQPPNRPPAADGDALVDAARARAAAANLGWGAVVAAHAAIEAKLLEALGPDAFKPSPPPVRPEMTTQTVKESAGAVQARVQASLTQGRADFQAQLLQHRTQLATQGASLPEASTQTPPLDIRQMLLDLQMPEDQKALLLARYDGMEQSRQKLLARLADSAKNASSVPPPSRQSARIAYSREQVLAAAQTGEPLRGARLVGLDFSEQDLHGLVLTDSEVIRSRFTGARLDGLVGTGTRWDACDLTGATLTNIDLSRGVVAASCLAQANLSGARLRSGRWLDSDLSDADLTGAQLDESSMNDCILERTRCTGMRAERARFVACVMNDGAWRDAVLIRASLTRCVATRLDMGGADLTKAGWNACRVDTARFGAIRAPGMSVSGGSVFERCDFRGADLRGASMHEARLRGADLSGACLDGARLSECDLIESRGDYAVARRIDLSGSNLSAANWFGADLRESRLRRAKLIAFEAHGANLFACDAREARCDGMRLDGALITRSTFEPELAT